jgi:hypothetical protein
MNQTTATAATAPPITPPIRPLRRLREPLPDGGAAPPEPRPPADPPPPGGRLLEPPPPAAGGAPGLPDWAPAGGAPGPGRGGGLLAAAAGSAAGGAGEGEGEGEEDAEGAPAGGITRWPVGGALTLPLALPRAAAPASRPAWTSRLSGDDCGASDGLRPRLRVMELPLTVKLS